MNLKRLDVREVLGIDIGHTIYDNPRKQPFLDAFRVIRRLTRERFGSQNVHVVSRVTPEQEIRARAFIEGREFQMEAGIPIQQAHFCAERHEKAPICVRLGITHFIDDRPGVLIHMPSTITKILFNPTERDVIEFAVHLPDMIQIQDWKEIENIFLGTPA